MGNQRYFIFILFFLSIFFTACEQNKLKIDVSDIPVNITIKRFDKALFSIDSNAVAKGREQLKKDFPEFYAIYFNNIIGVPESPNDSLIDGVIHKIITNASFKGLMKDCDSVYPDFSNLNAQFTDAFRHYNYYFPKKPIPAVVSFVDEFSFGAVNGDSTLGLGLPMFLGKDYPYYAQFQYPQYLSNRFTPLYAVPTAMKGFIEAEFSPLNRDKSFLNRMIVEGKTLYLLDALFPDLADSVKIGFTQAQLDWCKMYQGDMWADFVSSKLLYSNDPFAYGKYLEEAPFTAGFDKDAAPRLGVWTGWQIVRQYMQEHPEVSLSQLMEEADYRKILKEAKYKPKNS